MVEPSDTCTLTGLDIQDHVQTVRRVQESAVKASSFYDLDLPGVLSFEPTAFVWTTKEGMRGLVFRQKTMLHYCGYLELGDHFTKYDSYDDFDVRVHGGLTYMGRLEFVSAELDIDPFELSVGFDTAHYDDFSPGTQLLIPDMILRDGTYRDFEYVFNEVKSLSEQIAGMMRH